MSSEMVRSHSAAAMSSAHNKEPNNYLTLLDLALGILNGCEHKKNSHSARAHGRV
jgi:hypothetical protein